MTDTSIDAPERAKAEINSNALWVAAGIVASTIILIVLAQIFGNEYDNTLDWWELQWGSKDSLTFFAIVAGVIAAAVSFLSSMIFPVNGYLYKQVAEQAALVMSKDESFHELDIPYRSLPREGVVIIVNPISEFRYVEFKIKRDALSGKLNVYFSPISDWLLYKYETEQQRERRNMHHKTGTDKDPSNM